MFINVALWSVKLIMIFYSLYFTYAVIGEVNWFYQKPVIYRKRIILSLLEGTKACNKELLQILVLSISSIYLDYLLFFGVK